MKKLIVTGIITLISIMALAALTYGQTSGHAGHAMPAAPGGSHRDGHGTGTRYDGRLLHGRSRHDGRPGHGGLG